MTIDTNDPAYKLADATILALQGDLDAIDRAFDELKPTTQTLTRAYVLCLSTLRFSGTEATRLILGTLQYRLAEKSAHTLNVLNRWIAILTGVIVVFGIIDLILRLRGL